MRKVVVSIYGFKPLFLEGFFTLSTGDMQRDW
jgi:hypothetical protein